MTRVRIIAASIDRVPDNGIDRCVDRYLRGWYGARRARVLIHEVRQSLSRAAHRRYTVVPFAFARTSYNRTVQGNAGNASALYTDMCSAAASERGVWCRFAVAARGACTIDKRGENKK
jgi:hypothetical protein